MKMLEMKDFLIRWSYRTTYFIMVGLLFMGCKPENPPAENEEELITEVKLIFTSQSDATVVTALATDADGEGPLPMEVTLNPILESQTLYYLDIEIKNTVNNIDLTEEIREEGAEHKFYFQFTNDLFSSPLGDGNTDLFDDPINYLDSDIDGLPIGLSTSWQTGNPMNGGTFRIVLKHQPDVKSATASADVGETDIDLSWVLTIQ